MTSKSCKVTESRLMNANKFGYFSGVCSTIVVLIASAVVYYSKK